MKRTKSQIDSLLIEVNKQIINLISKSNIYNSRDIIQNITSLASDNIDLAFQISRIITKRSLEVNLK
jgi:hypothetical protein